MGGNDDKVDYDELVAADDWYDGGGGFDNYTPRTKDPGQLPFVLTFLYCFLLICLFPLFIALRQRLKKWRTQQQRRKEAAQDAKDVVPARDVVPQPVAAPVVAAVDVATGVSVESLYFEVGDGLTTIDTRQFQNQILILSSKFPVHVPPVEVRPVIRASKRHAVGNLLRSTGTPMRRFVQRWRCKSSQSSINGSSASSVKKKSEELIAVDEKTHTELEESKPSDDSAAAPIVVYQPLQDKESSDSSETHSSKEGDPSESGGLMETIIGDFVDDIKVYDEEQDLSSPQKDTTTLMASDALPKYHIDVYKGKRPFFVYFCSKGFRRKVKKCAAWDSEMHKILKLAAPFTLHAIANDVCDLLEVVVISQLLGTSALSAYFAVEFMVTLGTMIMHGT